MVEIKHIRVMKIVPCFCVYLVICFNVTDDVDHSQRNRFQMLNQDMRGLLRVPLHSAVSTLKVRSHLRFITHVLLRELFAKQWPVLQ